MNFVLFLQKYSNHQQLSKFGGWLASRENKTLKNLLIKIVIKLYNPNMQEALIEDPYCYKSFNAFFTRKLKANARPIHAEENSIVSPVDGILYAFGEMGKDEVFKAKAFNYSLNQLVVDKDITQKFHQGSFCCQYLAPRDYHRVHMPFAGKLMKTIYVPGKLYSVDPNILETIPGVFAKSIVAAG